MSSTLNSHPPGGEKTSDTRLRHRVARNVVWNWAGTAVEMVAGFVIAPFLVRRLGDTGYGLWIVIGSLSGYFSLIDFGLRGSVGRQLAYERAQENTEGANRIVSSSLAILSSLSVLTIGATLLAIAFFARVFETPQELVHAARLALFLVGVNLAISFPLQVFDGNLWASQRFDTLNFVDIPATLVRMALTFSFVRGPSDIVALAIITVTTTLATGGIKGILSFHYDPSLSIGLRYISRASGKALFGYGFWNFVLTVARMTKTQLSPVLIGAYLGIAVVTPFSIARRLQDYAHKVVWTATGVVVPIATRFHARSELRQQQNLLIQGGKYSTVAAVFFVGYFISLGRILISLWMGPAFAYVATLLIILAAGEFLQMTQSVTGSIILATARHRVLAVYAVLETALSVIFMVIAARRFGLLGISIAIAIPQLMFSGIATLFYGCRVTGVGPLRYVREALLPACMAGAVPVSLLAFLTMWAPPSAWPGLLLYSGLYTCVYAGACWIVLRPFSGGDVVRTVSAVFFSS